VVPFLAIKKHTQPPLKQKNPAFCWVLMVVVGLLKPYKMTPTGRELIAKTLGIHRKNLVVVPPVVPSWPIVILKSCYRFGRPWMIRPGVIC
jgi:hypothetical protein